MSYQAKLSFRYLKYSHKNRLNILRLMLFGYYKMLKVAFFSEKIIEFCGILLRKQL